MELALAIVIGILFGGGTYSLLRPSLVRMVIGFGLLSNGVNLLMIACGGFSLASGAPFVTDSTATSDLMDPLPPDIVLTAIVINFAVGALFLTICYVAYGDQGSDNPDLFRQVEDPDEAA
jgi:multicomponent Na+:H+ antiporter subunit C